MNSQNELRITEIRRIRKEKMIQEAFEKKAQTIENNQILENEMLRKTLEYKTNQLQTMHELLMKDENPNPKYNGTADQVKDLKAIRKRIGSLGGFIGRWPHLKRDENATTIPTKKKQMKYWHEAEELYFSPKYFADQRQTIERNYLIALQKKKDAKKNPKPKKKPIKKAKTETESDPPQLPVLVPIESAEPVQQEDFPEKF